MAPAVATATGAAPSIPGATAAEPSTTEADAHTALVARARSEGFVPKVRQGRNVYCRTSSDTGSHIASEKCVNEQQLQEYLTLLDQHRDDYQKMRECAKNGCAPTRNGISPGG